ncbi:MAG: sodium:calcium antiporter [Methanomassiliicoccus sp.]|nr:sodium:calcium antiporter [Methanomassiliicoccus sp.]
MLPALSLILLLVGAVALYFGSQWLVNGATALAMRYGVRPLVIGLTVIALGTSSPEAVLAIVSSLEGSSSISLGNVIGANISNGALVLGIACLMAPLALRLNEMRWESFFLLLSGPLLIALSWDGHLGPVDGAIMLAVLAIFSCSMYRGADRGKARTVVKEELELVQEVKSMTGTKIVTLIAAGIVLLSLGAQIIVEGASGLAIGLGVSPEVVGLTLVAVGTSVPEVAIAITASRKGQSEVVLGNVVGTIIINTLFILSLGALVGGYDTTGAETAVGMGVMTALSTMIVLLLALLDHGGRRTGMGFLAIYAGYLLLVILLA